VNTNLNEDEVLCIYSSASIDGRASAWVLNNYYEFRNVNVEFHPSGYGDTPPDCTGKTVFILDFSYPLYIIQEMAKVAHSVVIIDHHKTNIVNMGQWLSVPHIVTITCSLEVCSAIQTFNYFFNHNPIPTILTYVNDHNLHIHEFKETKAVIEYIYAQEQDMVTWTHVADSINNDLETVVELGEYLLNCKTKNINDYINTMLRYCYVDGVKVPALNVPKKYATQAAGMLAEGHPYAFCYWDTKDYREFSLRSNKEGIDVEYVARSFGGGGNKNVSGFKIRHGDINETRIVFEGTSVK
jgi:hypothetical protein